MANEKVQWLPVVFVAVLVVVLVAIVGVGLTGGAAWSTGENSRRTVYTTCADSDKGLAYTVKGTVTVSGVAYIDTCVTRNVNLPEKNWPTVASGSVLREYYCERGQLKSYVTYCTCSDGKCVNKVE